MKARTALYLLLLLSLTATALVAHLLVRRVEAEQDGAAMVINIAGRQRMLSQRVSLYAGEWLRQGREADHRRLETSIHRMRRQYEQLMLPADGTLFAARRTPQIQALYEEQGLRTDVEHFLDLASGIAAGQTDDGLRDLDVMMHLTSGEMLDKLDMAVGLYQADSERALTSLHRIETWTFFTMLVSLLLEALLIVRPLMQWGRRWQTLAMTDELTGLPNRRSFIHGCYEHLSQRKGVRSGAWLLMADIDNFKSINDRYGHQVGDLVLQHVAKRMREQLRKHDLIGRLGGEEFGLLFTGLDALQAQVVSERVISCVARSTCRLPSGERLQVTLSGGLTRAGEADALDQTLREADRLMYQAKKDGKAQVAYAFRVPTRPASDRIRAVHRAEDSAASMNVCTSAQRTAARSAQ